MVSDEDPLLMTTNSLTKVCLLADIPHNDMRCVSLSDRNVLVANTDSGAVSYTHLTLPTTPYV